MAPGTYAVTISLSGYQTQVFPGQVVASDQTTTINTSLVPNPGVLSGTVINSVTSSPISNVFIEVLQGSTPIQAGYTNPSGVYTFSSVPVGTYTVRASLSHYQTQTSSAAIQ